MYEFKAGPYRYVKPPELDKMLVERVESIVSADIARFAQAEYKEDEQTQADPGSQPTKTPDIKDSALADKNEAPK